MLSFNAKTGEIRIYGEIGENWFEEGITAAGVSDALDAMDGKRVTVRINSPGGVADEGIAIYNTLKRYAGGVDTVIDSVAASAASIIALAGESRTTLKGSRWMIHNAMAAGIGNSVEMRKLAEILDVYDASIAEIYGEYMTQSGDGIRAMMTAETWFDGASSLEVGLSTSLEEKAATEPAKVAAWFHNAPKDVSESKIAAAQLRPQPVARELARLKLRLNMTK